MFPLPDSVVSPTVSAPAKLECAPALYAPVLLQAADYELEYISYEVRKQFRRGVLVVYFVIVDHLPNITVVSRYYNVHFGKGGQWRPAKHGALVNDFRRLFPHRRVSRLDRFPVKWFGEQHVIGRVGTVEKDYEQNLLDAPYSVVRELVRCLL
jgi:hypothetical protein